MFFNTINEKNVDIAYLCEYFPVPINRDDQGNYFDERSLHFVLDFKKKDFHNQVSTVFDELYPQLGNNFAIAVMPPSDPNKNFKTPCHDLCKMIVKQAQKDGKNITDASDCLKRSFHIEANHENGTRRTVERNKNSMEVTAPPKIQGKNILILDDIVTTGKSMQAAKILLKDAGAREVKGFTVAKTINNYTNPLNTTLRYCFTLILDDTVLFSEPVQDLLSNGKATEAINRTKSLVKNIHLPEFVKYLSSQLNAEIFLATNAPRSYIEQTISEVDIDKKHIIAKEDGYGDITTAQIYSRIKYLTKIYERCYITISDNDLYLSESKSVGVSGVLLDWGHHFFTVNNVQYADHLYDEFRDIEINIGKILSTANNIRGKFNTNSSRYNNSGLYFEQLYCNIATTGFHYEHCMHVKGNIYYTNLFRPKTDEEMAAELKRIQEERVRRELENRPKPDILDKTFDATWNILGAVGKGLYKVTKEVVKATGKEVKKQLDKESEMGTPVGEYWDKTRVLFGEEPKQKPNTQKVKVDLTQKNNNRATAPKTGKNNKKENNIWKGKKPVTGYSYTNLSGGQIFKAKVTKVLENMVYVSFRTSIQGFSYASDKQGVIPYDEWSNSIPSQKIRTEVSIGDVVDAKIIGIDKEKDIFYLSKQEAVYELAWDNIKDLSKGKTRQCTAKVLYVHSLYWTSTDNKRMHTDTVFLEVEGIKTSISPDIIPGYDYDKYNLSDIKLLATIKELDKKAKKIVLDNIKPI